jgi:hypothetical protein
MFNDDRELVCVIDNKTKGGREREAVGRSEKVAARAAHAECAVTKAVKKFTMIFKIVALVAVLSASQAAAVIAREATIQALEPMLDDIAAAGLDGSAQTLGRCGDGMDVILLAGRIEERVRAEVGRERGGRG